MSVAQKHFAAPGAAQGGRAAGIMRGSVQPHLQAPRDSHNRKQEDTLGPVSKPEA